MRMSLHGAALRPSRRDQRGITLLESLVAIVILAIAVLGMLGVQLRTLADTQTGVRRAQAVRLIEDFAERIKSNPQGFAQFSTFVGNFDTTTPPAVLCDIAFCAPAQLAQWDVNKWRAAVSETLPMGQAAVFASTEESIAGTQRQLGVIVGWRANEYRRQADTTVQAADYKKLFNVNTLAANVQCPADLICHVAHVQP